MLNFPSSAQCVLGWKGGEEGVAQQQDGLITTNYYEINRPKKKGEFLTNCLFFSSGKKNMDGEKRHLRDGG